MFTEETPSAGDSSQGVRDSNFADMTNMHLEDDNVRSGHIFFSTVVQPEDKQVLIATYIVIIVTSTC